MLHAPARVARTARIGWPHGRRELRAVRRGGGAGGAQLTYGSYLRLPQLLDAQHLESDPPAHDELLFITIHQVYELWFQQLLHEARDGARRPGGDAGAESGGRDLWFARHLLSRMHVIERVLVQQVDVLETMTPQDFLEFRQRLAPASGFQSVQFRELEFLSGAKDAGYVDRFRGLTDAEKQRLARRLDEPSLWDGFVHVLGEAGLDTSSDEAITRRCARSPTTVRRTPTSGALAEALLQHDELAAAWRARHVVMVERMIGSKTGTGGSTGVDLPAQPAGPEVLPPAVGPPLGPLTHGPRNVRSDFLGSETECVDAARCRGRCAVLVSKRDGAGAEQVRTSHQVVQLRRVQGGQGARGRGRAGGAEGVLPPRRPRGPARAGRQPTCTAR